MTRPRLSRADFAAFEARALQRQTKAAAFIARQTALADRMRTDGQRLGGNLGEMMERLARMTEELIEATVKNLRRSA